MILHCYSFQPWIFLANTESSFSQDSSDWPKQNKKKKEKKRPSIAERRSNNVYCNGAWGDHGGKKKMWPFLIPGLKHCTGNKDNQYFTTYFTHMLKPNFNMIYTNIYVCLCVFHQLFIQCITVYMYVYVVDTRSDRLGIPSTYWQVPLLLRSDMMNASTLCCAQLSSAEWINSVGGLVCWAKHFTEARCKSHLCILNHCNSESGITAIWRALFR